MDTNKTYSFVSEKWDSSIIPNLQEFIKIPNISPGI